MATTEMHTTATRGLADSTASRWLLPLSAATVLLSAALLFLVQPMFARMILPRLGGTPAVWNTCLLFFQSTLLLGYLYVHLGTVRLAVRTQVVAHLLLMVVTAAMLPIALPGDPPPAGASPTGWLLATLSIAVGLPFFTVAATAPLLQRWFALASGQEPYFLYAASNLGSLLGLLGYPLVVERWLPVEQQSALWFGGFIALVALLGTCGALAAHSAAGDTGQVSAALQSASAIPGVETFGTRLWWLALAFVPSSLLLGVTTHLSTDVAAVPLLWVVPLAIYLLTFSAAFATRPPVSRVWAARIMPYLVLASFAALVMRQRSWWTLAVHLTTFAAVAMVCHRALADRRPAASQLTRYYLWISLGGALGGLFNALVAPVLFTQIVEFPLMLAAAMFLRSSPAWRGHALEPWPLVAGIPAVAFAVTMLATTLLPTGLGPWTIAGVFWFFAGAALAFANRTLPFAAAAAMLAAVVVFYPPQTGNRVIFAARTFFGVHRVMVTPTQHRLSHGTTLHGSQMLDARDRCSPTSYYHPSGPIGQLLRQRADRADRVAVIGLGTGGLACYARAGARWTFYEIDPMVERIARDASLFTFLQQSSGDIDVIVGDGRLTLSTESPGSFDVIVVDAFSSDAIPVHLLTREFLASAFERLRPGGVVAFHISNDYFDLEPVVSASAVSLGGSAVSQYFRAETADATDSKWLAMSRTAADLDDLAADARWTRARVGVRWWTDDFSNIFDALIRRR